jgi:hypothetical protein
VLPLGVVAIGGASGPNAPSPELLQWIEIARTRGDLDKTVLLQKGL